MSNHAMTANNQLERTAAVSRAIDDIGSILRNGRPELDQLPDIESVLASLAARPALFDAVAFPRPTTTDDCTYLIHQEIDGSLALYVSVALPGVVYEPHDHGETWASIVAVEGEQHHRFWSTDYGRLACVGQKTCCPGEPVSVPTGVIHSIDGGTGPLVHLHLYGLGFEHQGIRRMFDPSTGSESRAQLEDFSWIEDRRAANTSP